jgi:predicted amino acid dehydrogenase
MTRNETSRAAGPGSTLNDFRRLVDYLSVFVDHVGERAFESFYSVVPLATQFLALENPLFGTGASPFSVISILPRIRNPGVVRWEFDLGLEGRRALIDEIYDMAAPILLKDEEGFVDLQADTVHRDRLGDREPDIARFTSTLREKLALLRPVVLRLCGREGSRCAHVAHYGYAADLQREHAVVKQLAPALFDEWCTRSFPTVFELNFRGFHGDGGAVRAWILVISNSTEQLLTSLKLRREKIVQCARLAEQLGAQVVGMGGLVASFAGGGQFLAETFPALGFTTGHAFTIANIFEIATTAARTVALEWPHSTVAVVGAAGSIGSGCAQLLAAQAPKRMILIDVPGQRELAAVPAAVRAVNDRIQVICSYRLEDIREADLTIVATNWPGSLVAADHLKPGAIIIDDSYPKNVSPRVAKDRPDVVALEGGILRLPSGLEIDRSRNVPNLLDVPLTRMISCREVYGCFAETLTLAASGHAGNYGLGRSDPELAEDILARARRLGFTMAPLQFFGEAVGEQRVRRAVEARAPLAVR